MRKKAARRKTTKKPARLPERPLILPRGKGQRIPPFWSYGEDFEGAPRYTPLDGTPYWTVGMRIFGVEVPTDLGKAIAAHGEETYLDIHEVLSFEPWRFFDYLPANDGSRYTTKKSVDGKPPPPPDEWEDADLGDPKSWTKNPRGGWDDFLDFSYAELMVLHAAINTAMAHGFYLALTRYADDLKNVPEAEALLKAKREGAKKGGAARRAAAAPTHKAIRKRFRELRKTSPKKTARYLRIAEEFEMSDRHVARIVEGLD